MKFISRILIFSASLVLFNFAYGQSCPSWMSCDQPAPARYTNLAEKTQIYNSSNYYSQSKSNNLNQTFSQSGGNGVWRDEYAVYDPRLMPEHIKATGKRMFIFSPKARQWGAYNAQGELIAFGRANGGDHFCPDIKGVCNTPRGVYSVYRKGTESCISKSFPVGKGGAKMPYCMFFHNGYSIHGSPTLSLHNGSHGCIRVTIEAAQWLSANFIDYGTKVVVLPYR